MTILRNVLGVGFATLASRLLGFLRDTLIASVLGAGPVADAFVMALRLPNLFRRLFAEGAFAAAFVPSFVALRAEEGGDAARRFAGAAAVVLVAAVLALTVAVWIWAEPIVALLAPGWADDPEKIGLAARFTRLTFPYLAGVTVVALLGGLLAADRRFLAAAFAPVLFNLALIAVLLGARLAGEPPGSRIGTALAATVAAAGVAQMLLLVVVAHRAGALPRFAAPIPVAALRRFGRALGPGLVAGGFVEINIVVATAIASIEPGAVSWLYYADRLYQLPLGLVGIAVGQVLLPEIADAAVRRDPAVHDVQNRALEFASALVLPAAVGLVLLADPIVDVLFRRGAFSAADVDAAARALAILAIGLPAAVAVRLFSAAHWGRGDTRTPMLCGVAAVVLNVALALALRPLFGWIAVAWAGSAAVSANALLLLATLRRGGGWRFDAVARRRLPRIGLAALGMGAVVIGLDRAGLDAFVAAPELAPRLLGLAALILAGMAAHAG
ncbi:MAG: murein biosynthesis integral membrane protein MurJ, partial [Phyllobacteriaceae bacterium]|nr:murein biosynthesis integral membrane protein MurJ [Phyllobacteriaceae bacterium]